MLSALDEKYEVMMLFGEKVLFTCCRIDRKTVPKGLYAYDLRHDDEGRGDICEIARGVWVNHYGTVISDKPILLPDESYRLVYKHDYDYVDDVGLIENGNIKISNR